MSNYVEPTPRAYGYNVSASQDWNILVNDIKNHENRLLVLEGLAPEEPETPTPTNLPIGGIILWSGAIANIPQYFQLCDGTNGTPDLRNRFVIGAGGAYNPNDSGGADTHTHSIGSTGSAGGHSHSFSGSTGGPTSTTSFGSGGTSAPSAGHTHSYSGNTGSTGAHTHTNPNTGSGSTLPPYYALAYIMRVE